MVSSGCGCHRPHRLLCRPLPAALAGLVAQCADGAEAVDAVREHRPDVVLLDLEMPRVDGIAAATAIMKAEPHTRVIVVTRHARPGVLTRALRVGVHGFVPKSAPASKLATVIREVNLGGRYVDPEIAAATLTTLCPLSERELDALRLTRKGLTVREMTTRMHLAPETIRNYLSSANNKTGQTNRHSAARHAADQGWI